MGRTVQDWRGNKLEVGSKVIFGSPETAEEKANQTGIIIYMSDPDIETGEEQYGGEHVTGMVLEILTVFPDNSLEKTKARLITPQDWGDEEYYEEGGDIELLITLAGTHSTHEHTYTIRNGKPICVYCGQELEL